MTPVVVRRGPRPGDIGAVLRQHGELYAREYGYDLGYEAYVAETLAEGMSTFRPSHDALWLAEADGELVGSIAILGRSYEEAQLRWFLLDPRWRGQGVGRRLMEEALGFCRSVGYSRVYLWTVSGLAASAHLYRAHGFVKVEEHSREAWGTRINEEKHVLDLKAAR
jgi:GNAT superfamily N-acetyltransferase